MTVYLLQLIAAMKYNIETLTGSSVQVSIDSISAGSVTVASTVLFLSGDSTSSSTYASALTSGDTTSIFGTSFGDVAVDTQSVTTTSVDNPSKFAPAVLDLTGLSLLWQLLVMIMCSIRGSQAVS